MMCHAIAVFHASTQHQKRHMRCSHRSSPANVSRDSKLWRKWHLPYFASTIFYATWLLRHEASMALLGICNQSTCRTFNYVKADACQMLERLFNMAPRWLFLMVPITQLFYFRHKRVFYISSKLLLRTRDSSIKPFWNYTPTGLHGAYHHGRHNSS